MSKNLVTVLRERAQAQSGRSAVTFLQERCPPGERALLLFPPSLDYVVAFFGCLYAKTIAVPTYPPEPARLDRTLPKLQAIARSARPRVGLTTAELLPLVEAMLAGLPGFEDVQWLASDALDPALADRWQPAPIAGSDLAFLQYTSGSTAMPKGVKVTHGNLAHNLDHIARLAHVGEDSHAVVWLPPYHDMGLIGGILEPIFAGFPVTLLSPLHFLQRPVRWLQAITRKRGTDSAAPNFAYDLCVRKVTPEQRAQLDLSSWRVACEGAEPIRPETLERFAEAFGPCGFRASTLYPCYGLAEGTLIASGAHTRREPVVRAFDADSLAEGRAVAALEDEPGARRLVGCGHTLADQALRIVDPETGRERATGEIGEIWLSGASVAAGYWEQPQESERTFEARLDGERFLRTGDLGFVDATGELFVTGRLKDLIIVRGRNLYPQDIELTVERASAKIRPGCAVAFSFDMGGGEELVVVAEVAKGTEADALEGISSSIKSAVAREHSVSPGAIELVEPGALPKTSSGKLQRNATREAFFAGAFPSLLRAV